MKKILTILLLFTVCILNAQRTMFTDQNNYVAPPSPPVLVTTAVTAITGTTATSGGIITSDGGAIVTSRGLVWGTSPGASTFSSTSGTGTGTFLTNLTGLNISTTYYVRAFATNSVATVFGPEVSFTTITPPPILGASYGGGNVAYIFQSGNPGFIAGETHGIIISSVWMNNGNGTSWSSNTSQTGATSLLFGGGLINSNTIFSILGSNATAVSLCESYSAVQNGVTYSDWYLPSLNELSIIASNLNNNGFNSIWTSNRCSNCDWSWSSSEYVSGTNQVQIMDNGNLGTFPFPKDNSASNRIIVRAIRYF